MDAETMLDEMCDLERNHLRLEIGSFRMEESRKNIQKLRIQILQLIRAGLALQRLETFIRCQHYKDVTIKSNSKTRFNVLVDDYHDNSMWSMAVGDKPTLADAINAALDAAGEGT